LCNNPEERSSQWASQYLFLARLSDYQIKYDTFKAWGTIGRKDEFIRGLLGSLMEETISKTETYKEEQYLKMGFKETV
jgi:hypothetical protein